MKAQYAAAGPVVNRIDHDAIDIDAMSRLFD